MAFAMTSSMACPVSRSQRRVATTGAYSVQASQLEKSILHKLICTCPTTNSVGNLPQKTVYRTSTRNSERWVGWEQNTACHTSSSEGS